MLSGTFYNAVDPYLVLPIILTLKTHTHCVALYAHTTVNNTLFYTLRIRLAIQMILTITVLLHYHL